MPSIDSITVRFSISYITKYGEELRIAGSSKKLGDWQADKAPIMFYTNGGNWTLELSFDKDELPLEYKYVITKLEKKKNKVSNSPRENGEIEENEVEIEELVGLWEKTPNRTVLPKKALMQMKDKWEKLPQTESEIALEERNILLDDLKVLEGLIFPSFTLFPKRIGSKEFILGILGEPDKTTLKGLPKDKHRTLFYEGILRKNEDNHYQLFWLGRQNFVSKVLGERKYDISEHLPFEYKLLTIDDETGIQVAEILGSQTSIQAPTEDTIQHVESVDWPLTFKAISQKLGGDGLHSNEVFLWDPLNKKWSSGQKTGSSYIPRKQRKSTEFESLNSSKDPIQSVKVHSKDQTRGHSSYQYIPGETDILAIKTTEYGEDSFTYITVIDSQGRFIMPQVYIGPFKYEGLLLIKDLEASHSEAFIASSECDISDLRKREQEVREHIEGAQIKYTILKEQELVEKQT